MRRALLAAGVALTAGTGMALAAEQGEQDSRRDRWTALAPATLERTEVAAARIGRFVYVVGGFERRTGATVAAVERYDLRRDRWRRMPDMPVAVNHPAAAAYRGRLYVHGGYRGRRDLSGATGALQRFDPRTRRWRRLRGSRAPRAAHALAVVGRRLYAAGGSGSAGSLRSLEVYDFRRRRWRRGRSFPGPARNHTTGAASGRFFYVVAGRDAGNLAAVDRFDTRRRRWRRMPPLRTPRGGLASARLRDGRIVVFGGEDLGPGGTTIEQVELFDPRRRRWRALPDMRTPRHGLGGVSFRDRVYAIQGGPRPGFSFSSAIEALDVR